MNLRVKHIITILTITTALTVAFDSNSSVLVIPLNRTDHQSISIIAKRQHPLRVAVGSSKGNIDIIDIQRGIVIKSIKQLGNSVRQIISYGTNGFFFARDIKKVIMLDYQGNIVYKWKPKDPIVGMALAYNTTITGYLALVHYKFIEEFQFSEKPSNQTQPQPKIYDGFYNGIKLGALSLNHQYLHVVSDQNKRFTLVDPTISREVQIKPARTNTPSSQMQQSQFAYEKQQKQCPNKTEGSGNNFSQTRTKHGEIILERQFNFKMMDLLSDFKDVEQADAVGLMMVTNESVIYYVKMGSLVTFIPYKQQIDDKLLTYSFCQARYFLTLHQSTRQGQKSFYLSFFHKQTFIKEKVIELGALDPKISEVLSMDCNQKAIVVLAKDRLIVLENSYQEEQENEKYAAFVSYGQWVFTALVLLLFLCCCRGKNQSQDEGTAVQSLLQELDNESEHSQQEGGDQKENNSSSTVEGNKADDKESRQDSKSRKEGKACSKQKRKRKSG